MGKLLRYVIVCFLVGCTFKLHAQCDQLANNYFVNFEAPDLCAPTNVQYFTVRYSFLVSVDPSRIQIMYRWNDPANTISIVDASGLIVTNSNRSFEATSSFTYPESDECGFYPEAFIVVDGVVCSSSRQVQFASAWAPDNQFGANLSITPSSWDVCYEDAVVNAQFTDNSFFNCNINIEPDNPNQQERHVQFVYGNVATHDPANTILNLSLEDGGTQSLTDGAGNIASPVTRGIVTAAYFGPIETIPFPADGPISVSLPMNAPADAANLVGNEFEVTLFNWNICNPYNGNPMNPNYEDAISTTAVIRIVDEPVTNFETHKDSFTGEVPPGREFCIGQDIYFENLTTGAFEHHWQMFDGPDDSYPVANDTYEPMPIYAFDTPGQKLIRLTSANTTAQSSCERVFELVVNITPSRLAQLDITDLSDNPIPGIFCQSPGNGDSFDVRFHDVSTGPINAQTQWRWRFYDENGNNYRNEPSSGYSNSELGPFEETFTTPGIYRVRLFTRNSVTGCTSYDEIEIKVYPAPDLDFTTSAGCEGQPVQITDNSTLPVSLEGEQISLREWDFNYDGTNFNPDPAYKDSTDYQRPFPGAGDYDVALRVTTDTGCDFITVNTVSISPGPVADISTSDTMGCSPYSARLTNNSAGSQPTAIQEYIWETNDGSGWTVHDTQDPADTSFSAQYDIVLTNTGTSNIDYGVRLRAVATNGCEAVSPPVTITVLPQPMADFVATNYSPFNDNCSPVDVDFQVSAETQALSPMSYDWRIIYETDTIYEENTGTTPTFSYSFINNTQMVRDYTVSMAANYGAGCPAENSMIIRVNPVPVSTFQVDTVLLDCDRMRMRFTADQQGLGEYEWTIRENGIVTFTSTVVGGEFEHEFNRSATLRNVEVSMHATNFANCPSNVSSETFDVPATDPVNASFTATPPVQMLPNSTVTLTNNSTGNNLSYEWDFGDGTTTDVANPAPKTYDDFGTYIISLVVENNYGCRDSVVQSVQIDPIPPIVDFTYAPDEGCAPLTVEFTNLSQYADENSYFWDFGDGQGTSRAVHPTYTYTQAGVYSVSLSATNIVGDTIREIKNDIIEVYPNPIAAFIVKSPVVYIPDDPVYFRNDSRNASSFFWDFGDGTTSTEAQPVHMYEEEGIYTISLVATNTYGCSDTVREDGIIQAKLGGRLLVPNAFSPNLYGPTGGGLGEDPNSNDIFRPKVQGVVDYELLIFNRWGELIFESRDKNIGWDGYYKGELSPQDVYVYQIKATFINGERVLRTGDVNLIR